VIWDNIVKLKLLSDFGFILEELGGVHLDRFTFLNHHRVIPDYSIGSVDVLHFSAEIRNHLHQSLLRVDEVIFLFIQESLNMVELIRICIKAWLANHSLKWRRLYLLLTI